MGDEVTGRAHDVAYGGIEAALERAHRARSNAELVGDLARERSIHAITSLASGETPAMSPAVLARLRAMLQSPDAAGEHTVTPSTSGSSNRRPP